MPTVKPKTKRPRTRMETWLYAHRITYRELAAALSYHPSYGYRNVWTWAQGVPPTETERGMIIRALHSLGYKEVKASDLWA